MMDIQIMSDLHLEHYYGKEDRFINNLDPTSVDVLVIPGDLDVHQNLQSSLEKICSCYENAQVIYVAGNHEFYGSTKEKVFKTLTNASTSIRNLNWLNNNSVEIDGQRFIGSTMWFPYFEGSESIQYKMNDFKLIQDFESWVYEEHEKATTFLKENTKSTDIIVTHHLPSYRSIANQYKDNPMSGFFVSDMGELIVQKQPKLWIHGHTHFSCDYNIGNTRVVCNPFGYVNRQENEDYASKFMIKKLK